MDENKYKYTVIINSKSSRGINKTKKLYDSLLNTIDSIEESCIEYASYNNNGVDINTVL